VRFSVAWQPVSMHGYRNIVMPVVVWVGLDVYPQRFPIQKTDGPNRRSSYYALKGPFFSNLWTSPIPVRFSETKFDYASYYETAGESGSAVSLDRRQVSDFPTNHRALGNARSLSTGRPFGLADETF